MVVAESQSTHGLLIRLYYQVGGILVLPRAFGADHIVFLEHIHPLSAEYRMAVGGCQGVGYIFLASQSVTAVFRLAVDDVTDDAEGVGRLSD